MENNNEVSVVEQKTTPEKKKGNGLVAVVIVLLVLALLGAVGYIAYDKGWILSDKKETKERNETTTNNNSTNKNEKSKDIALDDSRFMTIYEKLRGYTYSMNRENGYKSFQDKELATIALSESEKEDYTKLDEKNIEYGSNYYTFAGTVLDKYLTKYFGQSVTIDKNRIKLLRVSTHINFDMQGSAIIIDNYDEKTDTIRVTIAPDGGTSGPMPKIIARKIVSAKQKDNDIIIEEKAIYYTERGDSNKEWFNIYEDPFHSQYIGSKEFEINNIENGEINVDEYIDRASTITHTFRLDKDTNKYYFVSSSIK